jgi:hypothetical protein
MNTPASAAAASRRVAVFIDYQNCYGAARETFFSPLDPRHLGGVNPTKLAHVMAAQGPGDYQLVYVGVYCGIAERRKDLPTFQARTKQIVVWRADGAVVFARPLRYPIGWTLGGLIKAEEKGVDVKLSIDAVMMAVRDMYDVAILASADSDLVPVAEALLELKATKGKPAVEAIAWKGAGYQQKLGLGGKAVITYCWITDYAAIEDSTDYNV